MRSLRPTLAICECGKPKASTSVACDACMWLDGESDDHRARRRSVAGAIVAYLRRVQRASVADIARAIGVAERNARSALRKMMASRRVSRFLEEVVSDERRIEARGEVRGAYAITRAPAAQRWTYYLTSR